MEYIDGREDAIMNAEKDKKDRLILIHSKQDNTDGENTSKGVNKLVKKLKNKESKKK